ncbi:hypothetical protein C0416_04545 [bacterium]|nr:hypothetical protein [bacterium]
MGLNHLTLKQMKKFLSVLVLVGVFITISPAAFASTSAEWSTKNVVASTVEISEVKPVESYVPYYSPINFTIALPARINVGNIFVSADHYINGVSSREDVSVKLASKYEAAKSALSKYGKVSRTYINIYEDYYDPTLYSSKPKTYSGNINIFVSLNKVSDYQAVYDQLVSLEFNSYPNVEIDEEEKIDLEASLADRINRLIEKKKGVYEKVLGRTLGEITSLYFDTWPDTNYFDPETGTVKVVLNANVSY